MITWPLHAARALRALPKSWLPYVLVGLVALWPLSLLWPAHDRSGVFAAESFGRLPVLANGRVQPLDSLARNSLLQLREKSTAQTAPGQSDSAELSAIQWLMEVMMNPPLADTRPVFRIDHPDLKGLMAVPLEASTEAKTDGKHYSWDQLRPKLETLQTEARRVGQIKTANQSSYEQAVLRLWNGVITYMRLENLIEPQDTKNWESEWHHFQDGIAAGVAAARAQQAGKPFDQAALDRTMKDLQRFDAMIQLEPPLPIPPLHPEVSRDAWMRTGEALMSTARGDLPSPALDAYARMAGAYRESRVSDFNTAVADYESVLQVAYQPELAKASHEHYFNHFAPFMTAMCIYLLAGLCAIAFWFEPVGLEWLRRTSFWLVVLALAVHTSGLLFRMMLEGRPPVTNLYSSAVFIGWGACILGIVLECFWRNSIGLVVSSTIGFITLIIAHHLSLTGDTMEMMRAVLDTNLWLSTHVVVVTLGYASTFVAGFLALIYILRGTFTSSLTKEVGQSLAKMVYGIICFATLFSFVGTVLGGIWADQSWGRFWGWDVKENGALIIVIWNALILHARWGGMVRERGLMVLAIGGNIVTSWSWFGVNMLGIGLHSYGFTSAAFYWLLTFVGSQVLVIVMGLCMRPPGVAAPDAALATTPPLPA